MPPVNKISLWRQRRKGKEKERVIARGVFVGKGKKRRFAFFSRIKQFVSLFPPLQPLDAPAVHLLGHLFVSLLLLLRCALVFDGLDSSLVGTKIGRKKGERKMC